MIRLNQTNFGAIGLQLEEVLNQKPFALEFSLTDCSGEWLIAAYLTGGVFTWFLGVYLLNWYLNKR